MWPFPTRKTRRARSTRPRRVTFRPRLLALEERALPATFTWINPAGGDWDNAANWQEQGTGANRVPGAADDAVIDLGANDFTVTIAAGDHPVRSLTCRDKLSIANGSLSVAAASEVDNTLCVDRGALAGSGSLSVNGPFHWIGATVSLAGGLALHGPTDVANDYDVPYVDRAMVTNYGTLTATGAGVWTAHGGGLVNEAGGTLRLDNSTSGRTDFTHSSLDNFGTIETSGTTVIGLNMTNEPGALIQADGGTLELGIDNGVNSYDGTFGQRPPGPGDAAPPSAAVKFDGSGTFAATSAIDFDNVTFQYGGGNLTTVAGSYAARLSTTIGYEAVQFTGTVHSVGALDLEPSGTADFTPAGGPADLELSGLKIYQGGLTGSVGVTVNGPFAWWGGPVSNAGGLTVNGPTDISDHGYTVNPILDGTTLTNHGTITWEGANMAILVSNSGKFVNAAGATLLATDGVLERNDFTHSTLDNFGTIETSGTTVIGLNMTNEPGALIQADGGTLELGIANGVNTYDGTLRQKPPGPGDAAPPSAAVGFDGSGTFAAPDPNTDDPGSSIDFDNVTFQYGGGNLTTVAGSFHATATTVMLASVTFTGSDVRPGALSVDSRGDNPGYSAADFSPATGPVTLTLDSLYLYGDLGGSDSFAVQGGFTWTAGTLAGPAGSSLTALAGSDLRPAAYWDLGLDGRTLVNPARQTATFTDYVLPGGTGYLYVVNNAHIVNAGTLDLATGGFIGDNARVGDAFLDNTGTVVARGSGTLTLQLAVGNSGTIDVEAGASLSVDGPFTEHLTSATQYGHIDDAGSVSLGGPLQVVLDGGFTLNGTTTFTLIGTQGGGSVSGTFANLPEGATVWDTTHTRSFTISYVGGDRNDVVLTTSVTVPAPSMIEGLVWVDFNDDGQVDFGEKAVAGVPVTLTGTDDLGHAVNQAVQTDANGVYCFTNLRPSSAAGYTVTETQPAGFPDGKDTLGTVNGVITGSAAVNDTFSGVVIAQGGSVAEDYNFGERPATTGAVAAGQTATIGFWQNKNGQKLILSLNGGASATQLGHWLAATFPNLYGSLDGKTNGDVAAFYKTLFARTAQTAPGGPPKVDAQVMATALAVYVTDQTLAGTTAAGYGFQVTATGVGTRTFNVGGNGAAFGAANNSSLSVLDLLLAVNARSRNGLLYDLNGDGRIDSSEAGYRTMANDVFSAINEAGGI